MKKVIIFIFCGLMLVTGIKAQDHSGHGAMDMKSSKQEDREIIYYTCGMHPSIKVNPEEYKKGSTQCPICHMDLVPVYKEYGEAGAGEEAAAVKLTKREVSLAGIETAKIGKLRLYKEIRTVGTVAFDPELRAAEEEYIQALNAYEKIKESKFMEAGERAKEILGAAEIKLELLGLSREWIEELKQTGQPHKNLILPDEKMWIYADIYDFESTWPGIGDKAEITAQADPSIIFKGRVESVEPVIDEKTRTIKLKVLAENKDNILKPNMYVDVYLNIDIGKDLAVPRDAVLDTGIRKIVYVEAGEGEYVLREVKVGPEVMAVTHGAKKRYYPVKEGLSVGEKVVIKANFLIDSQSQLTGPAAAAYGGALDKEEGKEKMMPPGHMH